jgi:acetylornithine deacetylase/succinyl-diaminopimelate desuccinylase-like protein
MKRSVGITAGACVAQAFSGTGMFASSSMPAPWDTLATLDTCENFVAPWIKGVAPSAVKNAPTGTVPTAITEAWSTSGDVVKTLMNIIATVPLSPGFNGDDWQSKGALVSVLKQRMAWFEKQGVAGVSGKVHEMVGRSPLLIVEVAASAGMEAAKTVVMYSHGDVQPGMGDWSNGRSAFEPNIEGPLLFGRGSADDGYAFFAEALAIMQLHRDGTAHGKIYIICETGEESTGDMSMWFEELQAEKAFGSNVGLVIISDSTVPNYDSLWLTTSLRGYGTLDVKVTTGSQAGHSGIFGGRASDPFVVLNEIIARVQDNRGKVTIEETYGDFPSAAKADLMNSAQTLGNSWVELGSISAEGTSGPSLTCQIPVEGPFSPAVVGALMAQSAWYPHLSLIGLDGVPTVANAGSILLPTLHARFNVRFGPLADSQVGADAIELAMNTMPMPSGAKVTAKFAGHATGMYTSPSDVDWFHTAAHKASTTYFGNEYATIGLGGSIPLVTEMQVAFPGAPLMITGAAGPTSGFHAINENVDTTEAARLTAAFALIIKEMYA